MAVIKASSSFITNIYQSPSNQSMSLHEITLPSNLEYSLKGLLSCCGHCSSRSDKVDLAPAVRSLSLKSRFSNRDPKSSAGQKARKQQNLEYKRKQHSANITQVNSKNKKKIIRVTLFSLNYLDCQQTHSYFFCSFSHKFV